MTREDEMTGFLMFFFYVEPLGLLTIRLQVEGGWEARVKEPTKNFHLSTGKKGFLCTVLEKTRQEKEKGGPGVSFGDTSRLWCLSVAQVLMLGGRLAESLRCRQGLSCGFCGVCGAQGWQKHGGISRE